MKVKKLASLLLSAVMVAASFQAVTAETAINVTSANQFATVGKGGAGGGKVLTDGSTGVSARAGKIWFQLSGAVDPQTLTAENVTMTKDDGTPVPCGADIYGSADRVAVKFGELEPGTGYTIRLGNGVAGADGSLMEYSLHFTTTDQEYLYYEDFEGYTESMQTEDIKAKLLENPQVEFSTFGKNVTMKILEENGNPALRIMNGENTEPNAGRVDKKIAIGGTNGMTTGFVFETKVRFEKSTPQVNIGKFDGARTSGSMVRWENNGDVIALNYRDSKEKREIFIKKPAPTQNYNIRLVFRPEDFEGAPADQFPGSDGPVRAFVVDTYYDMGDGKGYQLANSGIVTAADPTGAAKPSWTVTKLMPYSINGGTAAGQVSQIVLDDMKIYDHLPVQVMSANVKTGQTVQDDLSQIVLTFNTDIQPETLAGNIQLVSDDETAYTLAGTYDPDSRTYTAPIPAGTLLADHSYSIAISGVLSTDGFQYDEDTAISFDVVYAEEKITADSVAFDGAVLPSGSVGIPIATERISITLSEAADPATVSKETVLLDNTEYTVDCAGNVISIDPQLAGNTSYTLKLTEGITSADGTKKLLPLNYTFKTEKDPTAIAVESASIQNGAVNVPVKTQGISFTFDEPLDPATVAGGVSMTDGAGGSVPVTTSLSDGNAGLFVGFSGLAVNSQYTLTLSGAIKNALGTKSLTPYTVQFQTEDQSYLLNVDFEDELLYPTGQQPKNTDILYSTINNETVTVPPSYTVQKDPDTGNKFLRVETGVGNTSSRVLAQFDFTNGGANPGATESFVIEETLRFIQKDAKIDLGGDKFFNAYMTERGSTHFYVNGYPDPTSTTMRQQVLFDPIVLGKDYKIRLVYNKMNDEGKYRIDAYLDQGAGYKLVTQDVRLAQTTEELASRIDSIKLYSMNNELIPEYKSVIEIDDIRIYAYNPPMIQSSSIENLQSGVSTDTSMMTIVFNMDMDKSTISGIKLTNLATGEETALNSSYIPDSRSLEIEIPQGSLSQNNEYTISIDQACSQGGLKLEGAKSIRFTTSESFAEVELSAPVTFSETQGGPEAGSIYDLTSIWANIPLRRLVKEDVPAVAGLALYDENGKLVQLALKEQLITGDTVIQDVGLEDIGPIGYHWTAKAFLWESMDTMRPLIQAVEKDANVDLTMSTLFTDGMVLQREEPIPVWGQGFDLEDVSIMLTDGDEVVAQATARPEKGSWFAQLPAVEAGGPYVLTVVNGENTKVIENVMVGDVWLVSGQSNMEKQMNDSNYIADTQPDIDSAYDYPGIRLYKISQNAQSVAQGDIPKSAWETCTPVTVGKFSCVGYYFGRGIYESLEEGVPVGLIQSAVGGTKIERWISKEGIADYGVSGITANTSSTLYNGMIAPLQKFNIKGVLWYQGESDWDKPQYYENSLKALISSWRDEWNKPDMPFIYVQVAAYSKDGYNFAPIWNAQLNTLKNVDNTAMVSAVDLCDLNDIHPPYKDQVAARAVLAARAIAYGEEGLQYMGPIPQSIQLEGNSIRIRYDFAEGLHSTDDAIPGFRVIAGDQEASAKAVIDGEDIVLTWDGELVPESVSYCYTAEGGVTLYNSTDLPASPFLAAVGAE